MQHRPHSIRGVEHFEQMPGQTKAGDIGHRAGMAGQQGRRLPLRAGHAGPGGGDRAPGGRARHFGGENDASAERLGQDKPVARLRAAFADRGAIAEAGDGETKRQLGPGTGMATDHIRALGRENRRCRRHDLGQSAVLQCGAEAGQDDLAQGGLRCRPHRPDITEGMDRRDPRHQPGVGGEAAQMVGGQHLPRGGVRRAAEAQHCRIVAGAGQHIGAPHRRLVRKRAAQRPVSDLGPAAATERLIRQRLAQTERHFVGGRRCLRFRQVG